MYRFAFLASVMVNLQRGRGQAPRKPEDFLGPPPRRRRRLGDQEIRGLLEEARQVGLKVPGA